jgi:PadR family transcriptional regulator
VWPLTYKKISSYNLLMRRKPGSLLPLELQILEAGLDLRRGGNDQFHGFSIAREIQEHEGARRLTAHGTLYKALARLEKAGLLTSRWEDPARAEEEGRPRRRLYEVTGAGARAFSRAQLEHRERSRSAPELETT